MILLLKLMVLSLDLTKKPSRYVMLDYYEANIIIVSKEYNYMYYRIAGIFREYKFSRIEDTYTPDTYTPERDSLMLRMKIYHPF